MIETHELLWNAHGPLMTSENGHYLQHRDSTPFFWLGDTQWVLNNLSMPDAQRVLDDRMAKGFTVIQCCAVRLWQGVNWVGDLSWTAADTDGNPPFVDGDVTRLNPDYWERWRVLWDMAAARGLYLMLMVGYPARKEGPWQCRNNDECYQYGKAVGTFFRGVPNVLYSASMDFEGTMGMGVEAWRAIAQGLLDGDAGQDCFISYHPYTSSSKWFHKDQWLVANGIQGSRNETPDNDILVYQRVRADYERTDPVKPVLFLEGSYERERNMAAQLPPTTAYNVRMQFYYAFFAGAAGFTYGHCQNWQQYTSVGYLDAEGARQVGIGKRFLQEALWWQLQPDQSVLAAGEAGGEHRKVALVCRDAGKCLVYFPTQEEAMIRLDQLGGFGSFTASWFNPKDGIVLVDSIHIARTWSFVPPDGWEDAVLVLSGIQQTTPNGQP